MIGSVLKFLEDELNSFLQERFTTPDGKKSKEEKLVFGNVVNQSGSQGNLPDNTLVATLVNIEEERIHKSPEGYRRNVEGKFEKFNPNLRLNLHVLISAYFEDYGSAIRSLSEIILFFQIHSYLDSSTSANFPKGTIERLICEFRTLNFEEQNQLWSSLGAKYMPSVLVKIKTLYVADTESKGIVQPVSKRIFEYPGYDRVDAD